MSKPLSVAFVWHMHQPLYKNNLTGQYLMPWVRLHAIKDYLDMVVMLKKYPNIKQTFNLVPSLIDQINDYAVNNVHDLHSLLMIKDASEFTDKEKVFILERFFDANYDNVISKHHYYHHLFKKAKAQNASSNIHNFSDQEFEDIIVWFNLCWFDPIWREEIPELKQIFKQGKNYTLQQRIQLLEIQRNLIRQIIPTYKEYQDKGQIEIITSPYYHPIMPLIINNKEAKVARPDVKLPNQIFSHYEDAQVHMLKAKEQYEKLFGRPVRGIWPSEQSVSPETIKLLADQGIKWAISDEGVLAATLGQEFPRNFYGNLDSPAELCQPYNINIDGKSVNMIFRNVVYSDLIGFHFGRMDPHQASWELYDRIKDIQHKLTYSTDSHLLTIALDGENCWETFQEDGNIFLHNLYERLNNDENLNITTVSDYLDKNPPNKTLNHIHSGSWINRDFHIWIGDPAKNTGWDYLTQTRNDLVKLSNSLKYNDYTLKQAWEELYIAEGSDWFWWYGDPNFSPQDDLFDEQFRTHLQNVYRILNEPIPATLFIPVEVYLGRSIKYPSSTLRPCKGDKGTGEWKQSGCIEMSPGAMYQSDKFLRRIWFGYDQENLNIKLDTTYPLHEKNYEIYIYAYNPHRNRSNSNIRLRTKSKNNSDTFRFEYAYEIMLQQKDNNSFVTFSESIEDSLWEIKEHTKTKASVSAVIEFAIPFRELQVNPGEEIHFTVAVSKLDVLLEIAPKDYAISVKR